MPRSQAAADLLDPTDKTEIKGIICAEINSIAMAQLTMALDTDALLTLVEGVSTNNWPGWLACELILELDREFKPSDRIVLIHMSNKMEEITLRDDEDPCTKRMLRMSKTQ